MTDKLTPPVRCWCGEYHTGLNHPGEALHWVNLRAAQSAQPAAVGAKLSDDEVTKLNRLLKDDPSYADVIKYIESLLASTRAAAMEECAKICDHAFADEKAAGDVDEDFPQNAWTLICARAIRAAIGSADGGKTV